MNLCSRCCHIKFRPISESFAAQYGQSVGREYWYPLSALNSMYLHSRTLSALENTAACDGCVFCRLVEYELKYQSEVFGGRSTDGSWRPEVEEAAPVLLIRYSALDEDYNESLTVTCADRRVNLIQRRVPTSLFEFTSLHHDLSDISTGSSKSLRLVEYWLQKCVGEHDKCRRYAGRTPSPLPTRVLDVGVPGSQGQARLMVSSGLIASYLALSHCWGTTPIPTTTSKNFLERVSGINVASLPQNFRDAIAITKALGCRYLWIDSLCIIQDSKDDWDVESTRMQLVYRNALLTISAARSSDANGGCFVARDPGLNRPVALPLPRSVTSALQSEADKGEHTFWSPYKYPTPVGPLYQRAWVLQEQALSGRSLAFCEDTTFWDCMTAALNELKPDSQGVDNYRGFFHEFRSQILALETQPIAKRLRNSNKRKRKLYNTWYEIVREYTGRDLTYEVDKLPAISAMAEQMSRILDDEYLAGLWRRDLIRGLLWVCQDGATRGRRLAPPQPFIAPSWSWASVSGIPVTTQFSKDLDKGMVDQRSESGPAGNSEWEEMPVQCENDLEILEAICAPAGRNTFGQVLEGRLKVRGMVKTARLRLPKDLYDEESGEVIGGVSFDEVPWSEINGKEVSCLFMMWFISRQEEEPPGATCLALLPTGLGEQEYRRIGLAGLDEAYWKGGFEAMEITLV